MSDCLFCKIVDGAIPAKKVHDDALCIGFSDINPQAPHHVLFIPKKHLSSINDATPEDRELLGHLLISGAKYARDNGFADTGFRTIINTNKDAGQTVFHLHVHVLGGHALAMPLA